MALPTKDAGVVGDIEGQDGQQRSPITRVGNLLELAEVLPQRTDVASPNGSQQCFLGKSRTGACETGSAPCDDEATPTLDYLSMPVP
jgi:hypothetical protein